MLCWYVYPGICFERLKKTTKDLGQSSPYTGRVLKPVSPECEARVYSRQSDNECGGDDYDASVYPSH
jgi:hypothetical protein